MDTLDINNPPPTLTGIAGVPSPDQMDLASNFPPIAESSTHQLQQHLAIALESQNYVKAGITLVLLERRARHYPVFCELRQAIYAARQILGNLSFGAQNLQPAMSEEMVWFIRPNRLRCWSRNLLTGRISDPVASGIEDDGNYASDGSTKDGIDYFIVDETGTGHIVSSYCCYPLAIAAEADQMLDLLEFQEEVHHNQYFSPDITALSLEALDMNAQQRTLDRLEGQLKAQGYKIIPTNQTRESPLCMHSAGLWGAASKINQERFGIFPVLPLVDSLDLIQFEIWDFKFNHFAFSVKGTSLKYLMRAIEVAIANYLLDPNISTGKPLDVGNYSNENICEHLEDLGYSGDDSIDAVNGECYPKVKADGVTIFPAIVPIEPGNNLVDLSVVDWRANRGTEFIALIGVDLCFLTRTADMAIALYFTEGWNTEKDEPIII